MTKAERIPPHNLEAEQSLLGALLIDKEAIVKIADAVEARDFYRDIHGIVFQTMVDLYTAHEPIDILSLSNKLSEASKLEAIGGRAYLAQLTNMVPTASHVESYASIIKKKATLRRLIHTGSHIVELGYTEEDDVDNLLDKAEQDLFSVASGSSKDNFTSIGHILTDAFDRIDQLHAEGAKMRGVTTGFTDIDNMLAGFQPSDLIILAARPSMGKTALALDFARNAAMRGNAAVGMFSLEMSKEQLVDRMLCAEANVDLWKMRTGKLSSRPDNNEFGRIAEALDRLSQAKIFIDDSVLSNIMDMRAKARRLQSEHGLDLIMIDYLQLMEGRAGSESRTQEIAEITRALKGIARELGVPVIALSQLSRAVETRSPPIPKLADLRESGSIEQDADVVMFIYREDYYKRDGEKNNVAEILVAKHRNGPVGSVNLYFDVERASFKNLDNRPPLMDDPGIPDPFEAEITF